MRFTINLKFQTAIYLTTSDRNAFFQPLFCYAFRKHLLHPIKRKRSLNEKQLKSYGIWYESHADYLLSKQRCYQCHPSLSCLLTTTVSIGLPAKSCWEIGLPVEIIEYPTGSKALDYLQLHHNEGNILPDVILLELNMPVMNGWHSQRRIEGQSSMSKRAMYLRYKFIRRLSWFSYGERLYLCKALSRATGNLYKISQPLD